MRTRSMAGLFRCCVQAHLLLAVGAKPLKGRPINVGCGLGRERPGMGGSGSGEGEAWRKRRAERKGRAEGQGGGARQARRHGMAPTHTSAFVGSA